jgi:hypothetical protein
MPTTLDEAIQIIAALQATIAALQAENAALKQQLADVTARPDKPEPAKATPAINASTPKREKQPRRKRDPQHNHGRKRPPHPHRNACVGSLSRLWADLARGQRGSHAQGH